MSKHLPGFKTIKVEGIDGDKVVFTKTDFNHLVAWTEGMFRWGQNVRQDIIELERQLGISQGDPDDPPPPPWRPENNG